MVFYFIPHTSLRIHAILSFHCGLVNRPTLSLLALCVTLRLSASRWIVRSMAQADGPCPPVLRLPHYPQHYHTPPHHNRYLPIYHTHARSHAQDSLHTRVYLNRHVCTHKEPVVHTMLP